MVIGRKKDATRRGRRMILLALGLTAGLPFAARAQGLAPLMMAANERDTSADNEMLLAGDMIVTASRTAQRISDSPAAATVITADQIERSGATTIVELLRSVPGVDVMEPNKTQANVAIRGFNKIYANQVLVMVDGRSINQDVEGNVFWNTQPLLLSRIARIEIVRGPGSVLYGADAFGGVINIITKTPEECLSAQKRNAFTTAYGEHSSALVEAVNTTGKAGDWAVTVGAGYHGTDGFGERRAGDTRDSYSTPTLTADVQKRLPRGSLTLSANNSDATADLSVQTFVKDGKFHTRSVMLTYAEDRGRNPITARIYQASEKLDNPANSLTSKIVDIELQQQRQISSRHQLLYGGSYRHGDHTSTPTGPNTYGKSLKSLFVQDQIQLNASTNLFVGARYDDNSVYGSQLSPRLSMVRHLPKDQTLRLSYGAAFRAPTLVDSYLNFTVPLGPGLNFKAVGSTVLKPEKVRSFEAGYRKDAPAGYVGLNVFYNQITDLIGSKYVAFAPSPPLPPNIPLEAVQANIGGAHAAGFELESGFQAGAHLHCLMNYAYQNVTLDNGSQADFSPHHKVNLVLQSEESRRFTTYLATHFAGASKSQALTFRAYTTVDANVGYRVGGLDKPWTISLSGTNLLDDRHVEFVDPVDTQSVGKSGESQRRTLWIKLDGKF